MAKRPTAKRPAGKFRSNLEKERMAVQRDVRASERRERDINRLTRQLWRSTAKADAALLSLFDLLGKRFGPEAFDREVRAAAARSTES